MLFWILYQIPEHSLSVNFSKSLAATARCVCMEAANFQFLELAALNYA